MSSVQNQVDPSMILYIENFLDLEENLPNNLARIMTQIHELDTRRIKITKYLDSCLNKYCKNTINDDGKHNLLSKFQNLLIELQDLSDTKICLVQAINDKIDIKSRQLDANYRNAVNAMNANQSHQTSNGTNSNSYSTINGTSSSTNGRTANNLNTSQTPNTSINTSRTEVTNDRNTSSTTTASSKDTNTKDSNSSNHSNGNSKRTSRRSQGSTKNNNNHDSNGGSGDDRSSTPVASERANSGKKASKRGLKYGLKSDGKRLKASAYYNDSPPNVYDDTLIDPDEPTYCSCNQVSFGEMICCDNSSCPFEWFHFQCVALQTKPKGRWFCPDCRGERSNIQKK